MNEKSKKPSDKILDSNFYPDKNIPSFVGKDGKIKSRSELLKK